jgi:hypothetical protein
MERVGTVVALEHRDAHRMTLNSTVELEHHTTHLEPVITIVWDDGEPEEMGMLSRYEHTAGREGAYRREGLK